METPTSSEASRIEKMRRIEELGIDPWGHRLDDRMPIGEILELPTDQEERPKVRATGRIRLRRVKGKIHFIDIWDWTGQVQVMIGQKQVGEEGWALAENFDLGDLIAVEGEYGLTKVGERTIFAKKLYFMAKSLKEHPEKYHGMQDIETRLRQRYLDLVYTPETLERATKRVKIVRHIRSHLEKLGYFEVETPTLHAIAGGAAARPFTTHHNALDIELYLRIALELHLKRLLVGGIEKVYEIGRVFRNEGISHKHNPEFTMLELYEAYGDYRSMMDLTEGLVVSIIEMLGEGHKLQYTDATIDFSPPWQRATYAELFEQHVGVAMDDIDGLHKVAAEMDFPTEGKDTDVVIHHLFEEKVEDQLMGPVFVHDYPAALCPLTKRKRDNPKIAERFELYVHGMELANAYTELNDPVTQEQTFRQQLAGLPEEDSMAKMDDDFVLALRHGMPPAGGLGIGIDRLVMLLTNTQTIRDVILFPLLRPEK